jgi:hypothetical protein
MPSGRARKILSWLEAGLVWCMVLLLLKGTLVGMQVTHAGHGLLDSRTCSGT